jgi:hypothetical protein
MSFTQEVDPMKNESVELKATKVQRRTVAASLREAVVIAAAKAAVWDLSEARVRDVKQRRSGAVAAVKPADVLRINDELQDAEADAVASKLRLADLVTASKAAETSVIEAARAQIVSETVDLAHTYLEALDAAHKIGERVRELTLRDQLHTPLSEMTALTLPKVVEQALARLPQANPFETPVNILRGGGASSDAFARRMAVLTADDEMDVSVAA